MAVIFLYYFQPHKLGRDLVSRWLVDVVSHSPEHTKKERGSIWTACVAWTRRPQANCSREGGAALFTSHGRGYDEAVHLATSHSLPSSQVVNVPMARFLFSHGDNTPEPRRCASSRLTAAAQCQFRTFPSATAQVHQDFVRL